MTEILSSSSAATTARTAAGRGHKTIPVEAKSVVWNPTPAELRSFTEEMPNCRKTEFNNVNVGTRVVSRSKGSTYVATDTPEQHSDQTISRADYERGGLALHAGCKVIPVAGKNRVGLIVGLSGTGKTTTTFTKQNNSSPVQDDFCALLPGGKVYATENGCFAKTFGLNPKDEPTIFDACASPYAYLENVSQDENGKIDYFDTSYTPNGRAVIRMDDVAGAFDAREVKNVDFLLILNRNENIIPAVAKLEGPLAAAYFMLGETKGTSAGGATEARKSLRVQGTNQLFPLIHAFQGNRMLELMKQSPMDVYLKNTGRIGGHDKHHRSKKVKIQHSSAVVKSIADA